MGTIHQLRWDRPRTQSPRRFRLDTACVRRACGCDCCEGFLARGDPSHLALSFHIIDGDSLRTGSEEIRPVGIDAPELRQTCRDGQGSE
jgi:hypothetical protein